jgi:archaemetzincin
MHGNVAIISIHRLNPSFYGKPPDKQLLIERAVKEAVHEVGHMLLGLQHCDQPNCVMSFSNTIFDVDRKTKELCEKCRRKAGIYY